MSYTFFFRGSSVFSNWHIGEFSLYGQTFNCGEQAMMWMKAWLFGDLDVANQILEAKTPKEQKALGRKVGGFDEEMWDAMRTRVMYMVLVGKFGSNPEFWSALEETAPTALVEASPYDKIWGIGLSIEQAQQTPPEQWPGLNLLGKMMTKYRNDRMKGNVVSMSLDDILQVGIKAKQGA